MCFKEAGRMIIMGIKDVMEMLWLVFFRSTGSAPFEGWASFFMAC
jgi:hypothetical protein